MELDAAQLSSLSTSLREMIERLTRIADGLQGAPREDATADLYDVERNLRAADRRLQKLLQRLERTR